MPYADSSQPLMYIAPKGTYSTQLASGQVAQYKCPRGYFSTSLGATSVATCLICPPGFYCIEGTGDPSFYECPAGYYCPSGSDLPTKCPDTTSSTVKGAYTVNVCSPCPPG